jgi:hypothetical protein
MWGLAVSLDTTRRQNIYNIECGPGKASQRTQPGESRAGTPQELEHGGRTGAWTDTQAATTATYVSPKERQTNRHF